MRMHIAGYVAPEVLEGAPHTPAMDVWSMGCTLYVCITGRRPMQNQEAEDGTYARYEAVQYPRMRVRSACEVLVGF